MLVMEPQQEGVTPVVRQLFILPIPWFAVLQI